MQNALQEPMQELPASRRQSLPPGFATTWAIIFMFCLFCGATNGHAAPERDLTGPGLTTEFSATLDDVLQALQEDLQDQTIHGTTMFDREKTLTGATSVDSTPLFEPWREAGKVFYKVRTAVIAPRHFRDSADQGTIAVRYIVTSPSPERTRLRIDAIFVEASRHTSHASDGTVESSELKIVQERLQAIQNARQEAADAQRERESTELAKQAVARQRQDEITSLESADSSVRDLEQRIDSLRHQIEKRVKAPGASLKAAPFRSAADLMTLAAYTDVVIVIVTQRWLGVETPDGRRGWLPIEQLEPLP